VSGLNISNFIWNIADDVLRDVYVRGKYRDVILPMTVIRRLDAVLESTKDAVLRMKVQLDQAGIAHQHVALCQASGEAFYNTSPFRLRDLASRALDALSTRRIGAPWCSAGCGRRPAAAPSSSNSSDRATSNFRWRPNDARQSDQRQSRQREAA
jgi:HsdM N-terminal domain